MTRDEAYIVVGDLITKGFLTMNLHVGGKLVVFKTINEKEFQHIKLYAGSNKAEAQPFQFNMYFLVHSLLIVDGKYVLGNRYDTISDLYDFFADMPEKVCTRIMGELSKMREISYDALKFLEGYAYTSHSRNMWQSLNGHLPNEDTVTGFVGTGPLGMNVHQENWIVINRMLDNEEHRNHDFNMALFVASASNPKGVKSARTQHDSNMEGAEKHRERLAKIGHIDAKKTWRPDGWAAPVDTAEELVAELERQMSGVKDKHDLYIEEHMRKMKARADEQARKAKEKLEEYRRTNAGLPMIDGSTRIMTPEEVKKMMGKKSYVKEVPSENAPNPERDEHYLTKIGSRVLTGKK